MTKFKGFTLVELLAVIVILAIILAIAIPGITGLIERARKGAFEDSVKMIIKSISTKQATDGSYSITSLNAASMEDDLGVSNENYESITASTIGSKIYVNVVGQNKWDGLQASGTLTDLSVAGNGESVGPTIAPDSCYTFDSGTRTITDYDLDNFLCPHDLIISNTIGGISVEHIGPGAFTDPQTQFCCSGGGSSCTFGIDADYIHTEGDGYDYCYYYRDTFGVGPLTSVVIPNSVTSIGYSAFSYNQLTNVTLPNNITSIENHAFYFNQLPSITIPNTITNLEPGIFESNYITNLNIPNSVTTISREAFANNAIITLTIPDSVITIGDRAFDYNQINDLQIPSSVAAIGANAFKSNQLTNLTIPGNVDSVGFCAFAYNQLSNIDILDGVRSLDSLALVGNQITSINIPSSVEYIGNGILNNNQLPDDQAFIYARNSDETIDNTYLISYGGARLNNIVIPNNVITIGGIAFWLSNITSVTIPNSVTSINAQAFAGNQLTNIIIPSNVSSIGYDAFSSNPLTSLTIQGANPQRFNVDWANIGFPTNLIP